MKTPLIILFIASCFIFTACHKHEAAKADITVENPVAGQTYREGEEMNVKINFKSDDDLHNIAVFIDNVTEGGRVFSIERHLHVKTVTIDAPFTPSVERNSEMKLIAMTTDHDGNVGSKKEITFNVENINSDVNPVASISRPTASESFSKGQRMPIIGEVSHPDGLKNANLKVIRKSGSNETTVIDYSPTLANNAKSYTFDTAHVLNFSGHHVDFEIRLTATGINNRTTTTSIFKHVH